MAACDQHPRSIHPNRPALAAMAGAILVLAIGLPAPTLAQDASPAASDVSPASPDASEASPLPEGFSQKTVRQVERIIGSLPAIRGLPPADGVSYRVVDEATFQADLDAQFQEDHPEAAIAAEDAALTRIGLLGPEDDLAGLDLSLLDDQTLASYDPRTDEFSLVGPIRKLGPLESVVVAHEYDHALQDAAYDLEASRITDLDHSDARLAQQALAEGDATAVMYDWAARQLKVKDLLKASMGALSRQDAKALRRIPTLLRRQLEFPYIDGFAFVNALRGRGDWAAVDAAWHSQPASTEQIIHPERYPDDLPVDIELPDMAALLGPDWNASYEQTLGEMQIGVWVADGRKSKTIFSVLPPQLARSEAAAGWGGDRLVSLDGPEGAWAVVWQTAWDSRDDAVEFRETARKVVKDLPGATSVTGDSVVAGLSFPELVLVADSETTLSTVQTALGLTS